MEDEFYRLLEQMAYQPLTDAEAAKKVADDLEAAVIPPHSKTGLPADAICPRLPAYMKQQLIEKGEQPDVIKPTKARVHSKRIELFLYSCKVASAVAACLLMLFVTQLTTSEVSQSSDTTKTNNSYKSEFLLEKPSDSLSSYLSDGSSAVAGWLQDFSSCILEQIKK